MSATTIPSAMKNQCAHCNASTQVTCSGCSSQLGEEVQTPTYYCKKECQAAQWDTHKSACKAHQTKKLLYRAGETLHDIFYRYREVMFDMKVMKIEDRNGTLYVDEGYPDTASRMQISHEFPVSLVQNVEDKYALLACNACSEAIAWMQEVTGHFLTGKELLPRLQKLEYHQKTRREKLSSLRDFGDAKSSYTMIINSPVNPIGEIGQMNQCCYKVMKSSTVKWETEIGMPISSFLKLPQKQFEQQQKELCDFVADDLRSYQKLTLEQARKASKNSGGAPKASFTTEESLMDSFLKLMKHAK